MKRVVPFNKRLTTLLFIALFTGTIFSSLISPKPFGEAQTGVLTDSTFDASSSSSTLIQNGAGQDWYESRNDKQTLLFLDTANIGGNTGKKAGFTTDSTGNAYLTQEFSTPQTSVSVQWDIYINSILSTAPNRAGLMMIGYDGGNGPNRSGDVRLVYMDFYKSGGGTSGTMDLRALTSSGSATTIASGLNLKQWYTVKVVVDVAAKSYDVYVNGVLKGHFTNSGFAGTSVAYISFAQWSDGAGSFYVDNVYSPVPATTDCTLTVNTVGQGSVSITPQQATYSAGSTVQLTATPASGYTFSGYSGDLSGSSNPATVTMTDDKALTATFTQTTSGAISIVVDKNSVIYTNALTLGVQLDWEAELYRTTPAMQTLATDANVGMFRIWDFELQPCVKWSDTTKTGTWDWTKTDDLLRKIIANGAIPLIVMGKFNLATVKLYLPTGMANSATTGLPNPASWAAYCAEWVRHFKQVGISVKYYEIVNEANHYYGWVATDPKLGYFMSLFNAAAKAMRAADPNIKLGNDCLILVNVCDAFIAKGELVDFLSYHAYGSDGDLTATDASIFTYAEIRHMTVMPTKYGVTKAVELYKASRGKSLEVLRTESGLDWAHGGGADPRIPQMAGAVYTALSIRSAVLSGIKYSVYFSYASSAKVELQRTTKSTGFGMINSDDSKPWYPYYVYKMIGPSLDPNDKIVSSTVGSTDLRVLSWLHGGYMYTLIVNKVTQPRYVSITGMASQVSYQKVDNSVSYKTPSIQTGSVSTTNILLNGYTVLLLKCVA